MRFPVGTPDENAAAIDHLPGHWQNINPYANKYRFGYHTGADLVLHYPYENAGIDQPLYAIAPGVITFSGIGRGQTWGWIVIIKHPGGFCTRTAHGDHDVFSPKKAGQRVSEGEEIIPLGNADGYYGSGYHCHFDVCTTNALLNDPSDWPGLDLARLKANYVDPIQFIISRRKKAMANPPVPYRVTTGWQGNLIPAFERDTAGGWAIVAWYRVGDVLAVDTTSADEGFVPTPEGRWVNLALLTAAPDAVPAPAPPPLPVLSTQIMWVTADALIERAGPHHKATATGVKYEQGVRVSVQCADGKPISEPDTDGTDTYTYYQLSNSNWIAAVIDGVPYLSNTAPKQ